MTYKQTIQRLEGLQMFGAKPGLDRTLGLAAALGSPQDTLRFIHVAGTNGKGSTCAMLESIYRHAGLKVGLFTSPHLVTFSERIQVNRQAIPEADVVRLVEHIWPFVERMSQVDHPTFFEVVTVMALQYFHEQQCDLVVWETGLGGRLDSTNIVNPLACVITNIHYDHQKWLGYTLAEIAGEKSGIIKPGKPVVTAASEPEALAVIRSKAATQNAPMRVVTASEAESRLAPVLPLPLIGSHQRLNAATALACIDTLMDILPVSAQAIHEGLKQVRWPGRLELVKNERLGREFLLDGAHNRAGMDAFVNALRRHFPNDKPAVILGILRDKDWAEMCQKIAPCASRLLLVNVSSERTASALELQAVCAEANPKIPIGTYNCLADAIAAPVESRLTAVTGSLYLIGEAMELLGLTASLTGGERHLNEWGGTSRSKS